MMKRVLAASCGILLIILLSWCVYKIMPVKYAVKECELQGEYILIKVQKATSAPWQAVGNQSGKYAEPVDIWLSGSEPQGFNYDIECGNNVFVCYGKDMGQRETPSGINIIYEVKNWDILYPVRRNTIIPFLPKSWLSRSDME